MPTNEQRRATAKRKLERQLERRAAKERKRRILHDRRIRRRRDRRRRRGGGDRRPHQGRLGQPEHRLDRHTDHVEPRHRPAPAQLPAFAAPAGLGADCQYPATPDKASKPVKPPRTGKVPTDPAQVSASMATNQGNIGLMLDNAKSPCTVNSFASLAHQGFFNDTPCHRLTTSEALSVLQCGDPTGQGTGGPGLPVRQRVPDQPVPAGRSQAAGAGAVSPRHAGHGQRRAGHQRQPVLPGVQGLAAAAELHGVRHDRRDRPGHAGQDRRGRHGRRRPGRQAEVDDVQVKSILLD